LVLVEVAVLLSLLNQCCFSGRLRVSFARYLATVALLAVVVGGSFAFIRSDHEFTLRFIAGRRLALNWLNRS
jgi:hypothetical protein